ncbi:MAG: DUF47 family protein [Bacteroidetes bacterium]|nr:MAG: DUF47 family protein [Bacteroidota bacterium]
MFKKILPKEYSFFDFFEKVINIDVMMCYEFMRFTTQKTNFEDYVRKIKEYELEADKVTLECTEALHKTFITPFERTDILTLTKRLDDIADNLNAAAQCILLYDIQELRTDIFDFAEILNLSTNELVTAVKGLRDLKHNDSVKKSCMKIHELENRADEVHRMAIVKLFKEGNALEIVKWKEVFARLERAVDRCEDLANVIERIVVDNA